MLVTGGRFGWTRAVWLGRLTSCVVGLLGTAACGSRTSMLDPDAYGSGEGGTTATSPLGNAGKSSAAMGGRPVAAGGAPSTSAGSNSTGVPSGVDPSLAVAPCQQYCPGYGSQCKKSLMGKECIPTCQAELNDFGPICQALGVQTLNCLTPFFSRGGGDCGSAVNRALAQCGTVVTQFQLCKDNFAGSPTTPSLNVVRTCPHYGDLVPEGNCTHIFDCISGPYVTFCNPTGAGSMLRDCSCVTPNGQTLNGRLPASLDPCLDATALCQ